MTAQQLKNSILQLAVQGKLVPQDPNDEPASALLERIRAEKEALIKAKKIKREKNPSVIFRGADNTPYENADNEPPFEIPKTWVWVSHNELFEISGGSQPPKSKFSETPKPGYVRLYQIRDYGPHPIPVYIPEAMASKTTVKGDILLARYGASLGKVFFAEDGAYNVAMAKVIKLYSGSWIDDMYLYYYYQSDIYQSLVKGNSRSAQAGFNKEDLDELWFPLPPLDEQRRIVQTIETIIPYCVEYANKHEELEALNEAFPVELKKSILQWAVQGKLVPQDPTDEPAEVLLERIRDEKERLVREGKIKKDKHESVIFRRDNSHYEKRGVDTVCIDDALPFDIPETWCWTRLSSIAIKEVKRGKSPQYAENGSVYVFAQKCNVKSGGINMSLAKYLAPSAFSKYPAEEQMLDRDIIVNSTGGGTLGRIGIFHDSDRTNDYPIVPDSHVTIVRTSCEFAEDYIFYVFKYYQPYLEALGEGSTNQTELKPSVIADLFVPVPPLSEQKRIVKALARVLDQLSLL